MTVNSWDGDYNSTSIAPQELVRLQEAERAAETERRRLLNGEFQLPWISNPRIRENFTTLATRQPNEWETHLGHWSANRAIWICHDCGSFGYKYSFKESFKCNSYNCRSRNVTVCRAGEISMLIREAINISDHNQPGVNMTDVWGLRRARMRAARIEARRNR